MKKVFEVTESHCGFFITSKAGAYAHPAIRILRGRHCAHQVESWTDKEFFEYILISEGVKMNAEGRHILDLLWSEVQKMKESHEKETERRCSLMFR